MDAIILYSGLEYCAQNVVYDKLSNSWCGDAYFCFDNNKNYKYKCVFNKDYIVELIPIVERIKKDIVTLVSHSGLEVYVDKTNDTYSIDNAIWIDLQYGADDYIKNMLDNGRFKLAH